MRPRLFFLLVLLALAAGRMPAQSVTYTFDKAAEFAKYKTYKWVSIQGAQQLDELTHDQLLGALDMGLAKKGLTKSQADSADLYIGYQVAGHKDKPLKDPNVGIAYGSGGSGSAATTGTATLVHSGQLVLDIYDSSNQHLVWRGIASNFVDEAAGPAKKQKQMDKAAEKLLRNYPPPRKP